MSLARLNHIAAKPSRLVVGLMSGTSVDGIDAALVRIEGGGGSARVELVAFESLPFPPGVRAALLRLIDPLQTTVDEVCHWSFLLGEMFAAAVARVVERAGLALADVDLVGSQGQTVCHRPRPMPFEEPVDWLPAPIVTRSTMAIGEPAVIAERTGIATIGDFRVRDVAAGGHGAPIVAYADWVLLRSDTVGRGVQNIGGIANLTHLPRGCRIEEVTAFDTGPGNVLLDLLASELSGGRAAFDDDGRLAAAGSVRADILERWLRDPYFELPPPKTTGRERWIPFAHRLLEVNAGVPLEDLLATATALTARSIALAVERWVAPRGAIDELVVGGGGTHNGTLMRLLQEALPAVRVTTHESFGISSDAKEAIAMALLANDALLGLTTNVPGATGGRPTTLGKILP